MPVKWPNVDSQADTCTCLDINLVLAAVDDGLEYLETISPTTAPVDIETETTIAQIPGQKRA
tara:strand:+ start:151 stop:336 length:186 start_codon:yes stop_codon:yes gene_type:complete